MEEYDRKYFYLVMSLNVFFSVVRTRADVHSGVPTIGRTSTLPEDDEDDGGGDGEALGAFSGFFWAARVA